MKETASLTMAKQYLGKMVDVEFDRPLGTKHPDHGFVYEVNYGFVPGTIAPDGEALDVYYLGVDEPLEKATGRCIAIIHRRDDDDDKLIVVPEGMAMKHEDIASAVNFREKEYDSHVVSNEEIMNAVEFQEKWFDSTVVRED